MLTLKVQPKSHLLFIDSIRALAALYVMIYHSLLQYYDKLIVPYNVVFDYKLLILTKLILRFFCYGNYAVDLFIVVSGYSLMLSVAKNNLILKGRSLQFYKRRVIRILPPYYIASLFSLILIWLFIGHKTKTHWDISIPVNFNDVVYHFLLIHDFWNSTTYKINHAFWSIAVECRIYLFFPLLVLVWKKFGATSMLLFSLLVSVIGSLLFYALYKTNSDIALGTGVSPCIILFTFGMIAANLSLSANPAAISVRKAYEKVSLLTVAAAILLFLVLFTVLARPLTIFSNSRFKILQLDVKICDVLIGLFFASILFICAESGSKSNKPLLYKILSSPPLVFIGTFSYSLYLIHAPLIALIAEYIIKPLNFDRLLSASVLIVGGCPIIVIISYGFFYLFEQPFLMMGKKSNPSAIKQETVVNPAP